MAENVRIRTTCLLQGIRENREPPVVQRAFLQMPFVVDSLGDAESGAVLP